jgi:hypothetical protein
MRLPLIVAARPSVDTQFPSVVLRPGKWTFTSNSSDSVLVIRTENSDVVPQEGTVLDVHTTVRVVFLSIGSESSITVYACHSH